MRVGLTGGIGSGKSAVARLFAAWGATVIDSDVIAREVVAPGTAALAQIGKLWPDVLSADGLLDRAALAHIVFSDAAARDALTGIIHPRVRERALGDEALAPSGAIVVHVVPLLFEGDFWRLCDQTVLVVAPRAMRIARVMLRDNLRAEAIEARMDAQIDPARAADLAGYTISNDADMTVLELRARRCYDALLYRAAI